MDSDIATSLVTECSGMAGLVIITQHEKVKRYGRQAQVWAAELRDYFPTYADNLVHFIGQYSENVLDTCDTVVSALVSISSAGRKVKHWASNVVQSYRRQQRIKFFRRVRDSVEHVYWYQHIPAASRADTFPGLLPNTPPMTLPELPLGGSVIRATVTTRPSASGIFNISTFPSLPGNTTESPGRVVLADLLPARFTTGQRVGDVLTGRHRPENIGGKHRRRDEDTGLLDWYAHYLDTKETMTMPRVTV